MRSLTYLSLVLFSFSVPLFAAEPLFSAAPVIKIELEKLDAISVVDTKEFAKELKEKSKFRHVEKNYAILRVVGTSRLAKGLKFENIDEGKQGGKELDHCFRDTKITELHKRDNGTYFIANYLVDYSTDDDEGDNYCAIKITGEGVKTVIVIGYHESSG